MRILCICCEYPPIGGGGATVCSELNQTLVEAGHELHVVTSGMRDLPKYRMEHGVHVHRVPCIRRFRQYSTAWELLTQVFPSYLRAKQLTGEYKFDLIHCHFIVPSGIVAYFLEKTTGLPYVITAHGSDVPGYNPNRFSILHRIIEPIWRRILRNASTITSPSIFLKKLINSKLPVPIQIIPNGIGPVVRARLPRMNRILIATRLVERKGVQDFIDAIAGLDTAWRITVAGDGPFLSNLRTLSKEKNVPIEFLGLVSRPELSRLYCTSKIFVFPSHQENFPMVLLEAMAHGCAVVTTTASGCVEVVGDAAVLVPPGSIDELRSAISNLLSHEDLLTDLQRRSRKQAARFGIQNIARDYEALFKLICEDKRVD